MLEHWLLKSCFWYVKVSLLFIAPIFSYFITLNGVTGTPGHPSHRVKLAITRPAWPALSPLLSRRHPVSLPAARAAHMNRRWPRWRRLADTCPWRAPDEFAASTVSCHRSSQRAGIGVQRAIVRSTAQIEYVWALLPSLRNTRRGDSGPPI